jgi:hypothetical protein
MLWFFVDKHNRQRYFFICGLKRVMNDLRCEGPIERLLRTENLWYVSFPVSRSLTMISQTPFRQLYAGEEPMFYLYLPIVRIP